MAPGHSTSIQRFPPLDRVKRGILYIARSQHEIPANCSGGQKAIDYPYPQPVAFALATNTPPFEDDLPIYQHNTAIKTFAYILVRPGLDNTTPLTVVEFGDPFLDFAQRQDAGKKLLFLNTGFQSMTPGSG